jgi:phosphoenolpyruvate-protein kinase (PTS system EI component)
MGERALRGVSAAPGCATGQAVMLDQPDEAAPRKVPQPERRAELELALHALDEAATELEAIVLRLRQDHRVEEADIVETGVLMARDPGLAARVKALVMKSGRSAPSALREGADQIARDLAALPDPMLAERADDVRSLGRRAAARSAGVRKAIRGGVLVATVLGPADVAEFRSGTLGVALAGGGITAHAAIVARSLGLPMVVGLGPEALELKDGEEVVLDGDLGLLVRTPDPARIAAARSEADRRRMSRQRAVAHRLEPAVTKDGHRVRVLANAASAAEVLEALDQGAEGVGLLRTELTFLDAAAWPSPAQQVRLLKNILAPLAGRIATVRLFDFGGDKTPPFLRGATERGIALLLRSPDALKTQLAAVLDSGGETRLRILIPMVTDLDQIRAVRDALGSVLNGRPAPDVGAMIETPQAGRRAAEIAGEVDFLSLGTNDLTQLTLGLDREHSSSAPVTHPAVLGLIDQTMRAARAAHIPVDVCGEAASDPAVMPIMVGLGADELSVAAARVGEVREWVRGLEFATSQRTARGMLKSAVAGAPARATRRGR